MKTTIEACDMNGNNAEPVATYTDTEAQDDRDIIAADLENAGPEIEDVTVEEITYPSGAAGYRVSFLADLAPSETFYRIRHTF